MIEINYIYNHLKNKVWESNSSKKKDFRLLVAVQRLNLSATLSDHNEIIGKSNRTDKILTQCCFASNREVFLLKTLKPIKSSHSLIKHRLDVYVSKLERRSKHSNFRTVLVQLVL